MNKIFKTLEFDKIIDLLKEEVVLDITKEELDNFTLMDNIEEINTSLDEVDEAVRLYYRMSRFPLYFKEDVKYILSKVHKSGVINVNELLDIEKLLDTIKNNKIYLEKIESSNIEVIYYKEYIDQLIYQKELNLRIKEIVSPFGEILDTASSTLKDIRKRIKDTEKSLQSKLQEIISKNASKLTATFVSIRNDRYVIPVRNDSKNMIKGIVHDQSSSGETCFIEPLVILELNNKLNELKENEKREIFIILKNISLRIDENYDDLIISTKVIEHLDLIFGKATLAIKLKCNKPIINDKGIVNLKKCYHPLLNVDNVVSNDIRIGKDYKCIIITGPNTGGKTVLLKTIGLLSLMVKFGLLIPCSEDSEIMIFDKVFADIGDEQSINQNLSTFSSHLKNVINILDNVNNNSLVLLDELGSGTDPLEGSSLAISIIDYLIQKKCLIVATSHYSELKIHAYNSDNVINASVEFNINTLKPTYKLLIGIPGASNALSISKMLGLKKEIITSAEKLSLEKNDDLNKILNKLVNQSKELDEKIKYNESKRIEVENEILNINKLKQDIVDEKNHILTSAEEEAKKIVSKSFNKINQIINDLEELKNKDVKLHEISRIKGDLKNLKDEIHVVEEIIPENRDFQIKDSVFVENYNCYGIIIKINKNNKYDVQIGNATITVDKKYLKFSANNKTIEKLKPTSIINTKKNVKMTLDLRGLRYEDAKVELDRYIDDAIYAGLHSVSIIHGFGTGVIRELVQKSLKDNSNIESFRYGVAGEGGQGVTIVTFK